MKNKSVWLIDDDSSFGDYLHNWFQRNFQIELKTFRDVDALYMALKTQEHPHLLILDVRLEGNNGLRVSNNLHELYPEIKFVHVTSLDGEPILDEDYIILGKPINNKTFLEIIKQKIAA